MKKKLIVLSLAIFSVFPLVSLAVELVPPPGIIQNPLSIFDALFAILWPFFAAYAVLMFLVAGFLFLTAQGDSSKVKDARNALVFGAVGVAVGLLAFSIPWVLKVALGV